MLKEQGNFIFHQRGGAFAAGGAPVPVLGQSVIGQGNDHTALPGNLKELLVQQGTVGGHLKHEMAAGVPADAVALRKSLQDEAPTQQRLPAEKGDGGPV